MYIPAATLSRCTCTRIYISTEYMFPKKHIVVLHRVIHALGDSIEGMWLIVVSCIFQGLPLHSTSSCESLAVPKIIVSRSSKWSRHTRPRILLPPFTFRFKFSEPSGTSDPCLPPGLLHCVQSNIPCMTKPIKKPQVPLTFPISACNQYSHVRLCCNFPMKPCVFVDRELRCVSLQF